MVITSVTLVLGAEFLTWEIITFLAPCRQQYPASRPYPFLICKRIICSRPFLATGARSPLWCKLVKNNSLIVGMDAGAWDVWVIMCTSSGLWQIHYAVQQ